MTKRKHSAIDISTNYLNSKSSNDESTDFYKSAKITVEELKKYKQLSGMTDEELEQLSDAVFDLGMVAMNIIKEDTKKNQEL